MVLTACEPEPRGPVQTGAPESMHHETQFVRREVDRYKEAPTAASRKRVEQAFAKFDKKIGELEAELPNSIGDARTALERSVADLKRRRELHWTRAETLFAETQPIAKAEPVGEQAQRAEKASSSSSTPAARSARTSRPRYRQPVQIVRQPNFFQRLFRR